MEKEFLGEGTEKYQERYIVYLYHLLPEMYHILSYYVSISNYIIEYVLLCLDDLIDEPILERLLGSHVVVAVAVLFDTLETLTRVLREDTVEYLGGALDMPRGDTHVRSLSLHATEWLVDEYLAVRERETFSLRATGEDDTPHTRGETDTDGRDVAGEILHRVVDSETRGDMSPGGVHVESDRLFGVLLLEEEKLCDDRICHLALDHIREEDDTILQEARINIVDALAGGSFVDDGRDEEVRNGSNDFLLRVKGWHGGWWVKNTMDAL